MDVPPAPTDTGKNACGDAKPVAMLERPSIGPLAKASFKDVNAVGAPPFAPEAK